MSESKIKDIISHFPFKGDFIEAKETKTGLINTTFVLTFGDECGEYKYVLQKINTNVFTNPDELMSNIMNVTAFLRNKIKQNGGNPQRETLTFLYTNDSSPYFKDVENDCWRAYEHIGGCYTCDSVDEASKAYRAGKAFGHFQKLLSDYPADGLFETIKNFHNTPSRFADLEKAIEENKAGRLASVQKEIDFARSRISDASKLTDMLASEELPIRVTHNDTKINNVLFNQITNEAFCVIDLDTIMPGLSLYDFGDSIRTGAVTKDENERNLQTVSLDMELYEAYTDGFLSEAGEFLTQNEVNEMAFSVKLMALEVGVRFLTDYLNGDTYFSISYPDNNIDRCRNQFRLVEDVESKLDKMNEITQKLYGSAVN